MDRHSAALTGDLSQQSLSFLAGHRVIEHFTTCAAGWQGGI